MIVARTLGFVALTSIFVSTACADDEDAKRAEPVGSGGSAGSEAGPGGEGGSSGGAGGQAGSSGGAGAAGGAGGAGAAGGAAGAGGDCPTGYDDCDGDPGTVCETSLSELTSCGSCTTICEATNATATCDNMQCTLTCDAGYGDCDADLSNGCEVTLASDAQNCGACGRDCDAAGATCATDHCTAVSIALNLPFGSDGGQNRSWAVDADNAYHMAFSSYAVRRVPLDGSAVATVWDSVSKIAGNETLVVTATDVLWAERGTPSVMLKKPLAAQPADLPTVAFTPEYQPTFVRIQGGSYYWMSGDYQSGDPGGFVYERLVSAPSSDPGTQLVTVDQGTHGAVKDFNVTSDALFWVTDQASTYELRTAPISTGTPAPVPGGAITHFYGKPSLQVVGDTLYFNRAVGTGFTNGIYKLATGDVAPEQLVVADDVISLILDATSIYYLQQNVNGVWKAPLAGGQGVQLSDLGGAELIGQDATYVYMVASSCCASTLYKVVK